MQKIEYHEDGSVKSFVRGWTNSGSRLTQLPFQTENESRFLDFSAIVAADFQIHDQHGHYEADIRLSSGQHLRYHGKEVVTFIFDHINPPCFCCQPVKAAEDAADIAAAIN